MCFFFPLRSATIFSFSGPTILCCVTKFMTIPTFGFAFEMAFLCCMISARADSASRGSIISPLLSTKMLLSLY